MIEKMKFLSLTAPKTEFDRVVDSYLSKYEIHLENALSELRSVKDLRPFVETNPYREEWKLANDLVQNLPAQSTPVRERSLEEAVDAVRSIRQTLAQLNDREAELEKQLETYTASYEQVAPFTQLNYDISSILHFRCIKFRFGRISLEYFEKFQSFVYDAVDTILFKCREDEEYVWLVYFTPAPCADKVDAIYASMHFERLFLPDDYEGTPKEAAQLLEEKIAGVKADLEKHSQRTTVRSGKPQGGTDRRRRASEPLYQKLRCAQAGSLHQP